MCVRVHVCACVCVRRLPVMSSRTTALVAVAAVAAGGSLVIYVGVPSGLSLLGFKGAGISAGIMIIMYSMFRRISRTLKRQ